MFLGGSKTAEKGPAFFFRHGKPDIVIQPADEGWETSVLGLDDTDSASMGMCTTYLAALIVEEALEEGGEVRLPDYPHLVRLNPQVPNKTRGNGAVAISFATAPGVSGKVFDLASRLIAENAALEDEWTHPGMAMTTAPSPSPGLRRFYGRCLHRIVSRREALETARKYGVRTLLLKRGLGVIGAVAALGADFTGDQTFEVMVYRGAGARGRKREVDPELVIRMDREVTGTFYNYDHVHGKVCITPATPCPVNFGVRGEEPESVLKAFEFLEGRKSPLAMIFRTNQHTDAHIEPVRKIASVLPRSSALVAGRVIARPRSTPGGHVLVTIADGSGHLDCMAYEPTKEFRKVVRELIPGDRLHAYGSIRPAGEGHGPTLNLEKVELLELVSTRTESPRCPQCGARMSSMGRTAGYRCSRKGCGHRDPHARRVQAPIKRAVSRGFHEPPLVAWRHLYKPISRMKG